MTAAILCLHLCLMGLLDHGQEELELEYRPLQGPQLDQGLYAHYWIHKVPGIDSRGRHDRPRPRRTAVGAPPSALAHALLSSGADCPNDAGSHWRTAVRVPESPAPVGVRRRAGEGRAGICSRRSLQERREMQGRARYGASLATLLAGNLCDGLFLKPALIEPPYSFRKPQSHLPILLLHSLLSFASTASPVLGMDVTMNPGASLSTFTAVPFPPPIPGAQDRPPWQQHLPRPNTPAFPPGSSLLLPAFPRTPLVANGGRGPSAPGACNLTVQVRSQGRTVEAPQTQTFVVTQAPLNWSAPGVLSRSAACLAPVFLATPVMGTVVTAPAVGVSQAGKGGWTPGFPPQAPAPAAQLAPIIRPVNSGPWPHGASREGRLATNQSNASQDGSSNPQREYSNCRRWQRFKPLARRHFHRSPDAEAFSCFLIPVLRSLARRKPSMTQEEGLRRAVQEWRRLSKLDRMIYYERAEKFMEFAAEEEIHIQNLQCMQCAQDLPPPAPPKLDPPGPPAPVIPPETVREYVDRMEALVGPVHSGRGKSHAECGKDGNEPKQEEDDSYMDPCLLSYMDKQRSREDSVTKVEAVIHPRFLAELLSPDPQLDLLALAKELKQEEGLTPEELVQKRLLAL
ncbi:NUT family member 2G-like, partial [Balaenoptera acutorostrata]|uniref:NUT family member 2G-like n=1 Tax=Balaenoptera acutorostrata TaxID=9767 RepID=A0ABM3TQJ0_BALAC